MAPVMGAFHLSCAATRRGRLFVTRHARERVATFNVESASDLVATCRQVESLPHERD
jgi:hypothetical protein